MPVPAYKKFKLTEPIDFVPAGATGRVNRVDRDHVALIFDKHPDLVFDIHDTEPAVWAAIRPKHTVGWRRLAIAASLAAAFIAGGAVLPDAAAAVQAAVEFLPSLIYEESP
jgi:hypothetical protein